jgi:hypothetical protein
VLIVALALLAFGAITATSLAWRGTERLVPTVVPYEVRSTLIYAAPTSASEFDLFEPESGVAPAVNLDVGSVLPLAHFATVVTDGRPRNDVRLTGAQLLRVEVRSPEGETVPVSTAMGRVDDPDGAAALDVELALLGTVLAAVDDESAAEGPQVVISAASTLGGTLAGTPFSQPVEQQLIFGLDGRQLRLLAGSEPELTTEGEVSGTLGEPRFGSVPLLGDVRLSHLLVASIVLAVVALVIVDLVAVVSLLERSKGELRRARRRYGHLLVPVSPIALPRRIVEVPSMDRLARTAARLRRPILEVRDERAVEFVVLEPGLAYCHRIRRAGRPGPSSSR